MYFCFMQKTAYDMLISDWSSDVCSSDLLYLREAHATRPPREVVERYLRFGQANALRPDSRTVRAGGVGRKRMQGRIAAPNWHEIGRELTVGGELYGHVTYRRDVPLFIPLDGSEPTKHRSLVELRRYVAERYQAERWPNRSRAALPEIGRAHV